MSTQVSGSVGIALNNVTAQDTKGLSTISTVVNLPQLISQAFTNGSAAANKTNQFYQARLTQTISGATDIDLYAFGAVTDGAGNAITMATIKLILIVVQGISLGTTPATFTVTETDNLVFGGKGTTAGWTSVFGTNAHTIKIPAGGAFLFYDPGATGFVVGNSTTNHILTVTAPANSGTLTYDVYVLGATA